MAATEKQAKDTVDDLANVVEFPQKETPVTRDFGVLGFSPNSPSPVSAKVLSNFNKAAEIARKKQETEANRTRSLAMKLISDKKRAVFVIEQINKASLPMVSSVNSLIAIAHIIDPGQSVTAERLADMLGGLPDDITKKMWSDSFMPIVDMVGLTIKDSPTSRRFPHSGELLCKCSSAINFLVQTGDFMFRISDQIAGTVIRVDPYSDQTRNGEVIRHEKPHQTAEGKALARQLADSEYKARVAEAIRKNQRIADGDHESGNYGSMNLLGDFSKNKPMLAVAGLAAVLAVAAFAEIGSKQPREINPALASVPTFNAAAIAAQAGE